MRFITGLLFTFICLLPAGSMAQNKVTLSGKVIDQHGTPIAQATIAVENTTSGTYMSYPDIGRHIYKLINVLLL